MEMNRRRVTDRTRHEAAVRCGHTKVIQRLNHLKTIFRCGQILKEKDDRTKKYPFEVCNNSIYNLRLGLVAILETKIRE